MIGGTIPALLTPFTDGGRAVDLDAMHEHVAWLHERGVRCVSPLGTTGEGPSLAMDERKRIVERLARHPSGMALLPGTGRDSLPEAIELSRHAFAHGAVGVLVLPPWYYGADARAATAWFDAILRALPEDARVFLYHIPSHTGVPITDEMLTALLEQHGERVAGVKDSGGDLDHARAWLRTYPELTILPGSDAFAASAYEAGARGTITMLANVFPDELEAIRAGDAVDQRQTFLTAVRELVSHLPRHAALKHLLHLVGGLPRSSVRLPLCELAVSQRAELETRFSDLRSEAHV